MRACRVAEKETRLRVRGALNEAGQSVRQEAITRFIRIDLYSAENFRVYVRQRGIGVEQRLRKTTGLHPEFGRLQMRKALLPARAEKMPETERRLEEAIDKMADHFERGH